MKEKEMATTEPKTVAPAFAFGADIGAGLEGTDKECFAIPFLRVIQSGSPQVKRTEAAYNPAAKEGMLINSVTGELIDGDEGLIIIPCAFQRRFIRWGGVGKPDEGKFKGEFTPEEIDALKAAGKVIDLDGYPTIEGDELTDTRSHYVLIESETGFTQALFPLGSTQIKKSKQLLSILSSIKVRVDGKLVTPPTWMNRIKVTTVPESNDKGSWMGVKFEVAGFIEDEEIYKAGKAFNEAVAGGAVKAAYAAEESAVPNKF
jgi:hypothetical protein